MIDLRSSELNKNPEVNDTFWADLEKVCPDGANYLRLLIDDLLHFETAAYQQDFSLLDSVVVDAAFEELVEEIAAEFAKVKEPESKEVLGEYFAILAEYFNERDYPVINYLLQERLFDFYMPEEEETNVSQEVFIQKKRPFVVQDFAINGIDKERFLRAVGLVCEIGGKHLVWKDPLGELRGSTISAHKPKDKLYFRPLTHELFDNGISVDRLETACKNLGYGFKRR